MELTIVIDKPLPKRISRIVDSLPYTIYRYREGKTTIHMVGDRKRLLRIAEYHNKLVLL